MTGAKKIANFGGKWVRPPPPLSNENNFVLADFFSELDNGHVSSKKMCLY